MTISHVFFALLLGLLGLLSCLEQNLQAQNSNSESEQDVLTPAEWKRVDQGVERSLQWLASQQQSNGSFPTLPQGQPGVTSLCVMAFASHGHLPGEGPYGEQLNRALDFIIRCQKPNGLLTTVGPLGRKISRDVEYKIGVSAVYNHTIASLVLSEVYGIGGSEQATRLQPIIEKALQTSLAMQFWPKERPIDQGGLRYLKPYKNIHSDLSLTGWHLMFLRSAKNAGFEVPEEPVQQAVNYVRRCFNSRYGVFEYTARDGDGRSRAMAGAGVLAFAHAGLHHSQEARRSGDWIRKYHFDRYNRVEEFTRQYPKDRYHYGVFNCCQAMYQLGGEHWQQFFPRVTKTLLANQARDGAWQAENHPEDRKFGRAYTTALVVLALGAPNQFLPVFQR